MTLFLRPWSADPVVLTGYVIVAVVHLRGLRALVRPPDDGLHAALRREAILFQCGWAAVLLALVSPLGYWSSKYAWAHATQHLIAPAVAAPFPVASPPLPPPRSPHPP